MASQENTHVEESHDHRKYEVGQTLVFVGYNPEETDVAPVDDGFDLEDILIVNPRNKCGMGIDVTRQRDGKSDMVWPEEVELARENT